jgi:hypothetical protein
MKIDKARDRYLNDPVYHEAVRALQGIVLRLEMTPSELREVATFACILLEERTPAFRWSSANGVGPWCPDAGAGSDWDGRAMGPSDLAAAEAFLRESAKPKTAREIAQDMADLAAAASIGVSVSLNGETVPAKAAPAGDCVHSPLPGKHCPVCQPRVEGYVGPRTPRDDVAWWGPMAQSQVAGSVARDCHAVQLGMPITTLCGAPMPPDAIRFGVVIPRRLPSVERVCVDCTARIDYGTGAPMVDTLDAPEGTT